MLQFKFHKVLKYFLLSNGRITLRRLNTIKDFATPFLSLTSHTINLLLWKKIVSLTLFKIITVITSSTLIRVFFVGGSGYETEGRGLGTALPTHSQNFEPSPPFLLYIFQPKIECSPFHPFLHVSTHPSFDCRPLIEEKYL